MSESDLGDLMLCMSNWHDDPLVQAYMEVLCEHVNSLFMEEKEEE